MFEDAQEIIGKKRTYTYVHTITWTDVCTYEANNILCSYICICAYVVY